MLQNKLVQYRNTFIEKCYYLYSREPYATDELKNLAEIILKNHDDTVKKLLVNVEEEIKQIESLKERKGEK